MLLTRGECLQILSKLLNVENERLHLVDYELERDKEAVGYLGEYYTLTLIYCTTASKTQVERVFVKALQQQSDEAEKESIFRKEALLYETLLNEMQKYSRITWSPKSFYTRSDLIVLENMKLIGYCGAGNTMLSMNQMHQLLRALAAFHAASLVYEQREGINIGKQFGEYLYEITVAPNIDWYTTGISAILAVIKTLPQYQPSMDSQLADAVQRVYEQISPSSKYRNVVCHRDLWAANVFFPADHKDAALLIDFQTCRYSPPAVDLCFSLYLNLTSAERRRVEVNCIDLYYKCLQKDLQDFGLESAELIPKSELLQSYEEFRLFGALYNALVATVIKVPREFVTNAFKYVDRSAVILDYMRENQEFRDVMEKCCLEVIEIALVK
ncbi:uncharacterized protein LOC6562176 [Drosophila grimshawi]|uniref:GH11335 n=1 Tax=Drosophila grimshawi TaxID=7222 RepID=B4JEA0_DROGR|nr:uncharacterized protein LOC6562176 [Drosophila grimshawi]EDW03620.1 GH11335 [Drosophila grimshawi]